MTTLDDVQTKLRDAGLPEAPIPGAFQGRVQALGDWTFGTRTPPHALYDVDSFVDEAVAGTGDDYLLVGHDGYGVNNWALHYLLKTDRLALFVQLPWGGGLDEEDRPGLVNRIASAFRAVPQFLQRLEAAVANGRPLPGQTLVVVQSLSSGPRWAWVSPGQPVTWHEERDNALKPAFDSIPA
jgi:hypothetical protein